MAELKTTIVAVSYEAVRNLGNYESERLRADAIVGDGQDPALALRDLRSFVEAYLQPSPGNHAARYEWAVRVAAAPELFTASQRFLAGQIREQEESRRAAVEQRRLLAAGNDDEIVF